MRREPAVAAVLAVVAVLGSLAGCTDQDPYSDFRQAAPEDIPGTFGWRLTPPDDGTPRLTPDEAYRGLPGSEPDADVMVSLAVVASEDGSTTPTAWVFITRGLCYFTAKGDLVSPGRSGEDPCTEDNLLVQAVDAQDGSLVRVFSAYDVTQGWLPTREGDPANDQAVGTTRFH